MSKQRGARSANSSTSSPSRSAPLPQKLRLCFRIKTACSSDAAAGYGSICGGLPAGKSGFGAHIQWMARLLKTILIVSGIFAGWLALSVLTFDDNIEIYAEYVEN